MTAFPKSRWVVLAGAAAALAGGLLFLVLEQIPCALQSPVLGLDACAGPMPPHVVRFFHRLGGNLIAAGTVLLVFNRYIGTALTSLRASWRAGMRHIRHAWGRLGPHARIAALAITGAGAVTRAMYVRQPMRYDEAWTFLDFASMPWFGAVSNYTLPNNHILHTLLVRSITGLVGGEEWAIRLPALSAGLLLIPAVFLLARTLYGAMTAWLAAALVAASAPLILYSTNARGYSMVALCAVLLAWIATRLAARWNAGDALLFVVVAAAGLYTVPIFILPLLGVGVWLAIQRSDGSAWRQLARSAVVLAASAVAAAWLYLPVLANTGLGSLVSNRFVTGAAPAEPFLHHALEVWKQWTGGMLLPVEVLLLAGIVAGLIIARGRRHSLVGMLLLVAGAYLLATQRPPPGRVWLYLLPFLLTAGAYGLLQIYELAALRARRRLPDSAVPVIAACAAVVLCLGVVLSETVLEDPEGGVLPDAPGIAEWLSERTGPGVAVVTSLPSDAPLHFYLLRDSVRIPTGARVVATGRTLYVVVNLRYAQTLTGVLDPNGLEVIRADGSGTVLFEMTRFVETDKTGVVLFRNPEVAVVFPEAAVIRMDRALPPVAWDTARVTAVRAAWKLSQTAPPARP